MPDPKQDDDEDQAYDPNARWGSDAAGVEPIGGETEVEDLTTEDQRKRNAEAQRIREQSLALAQRLADDGAGEDDDDEGDAEKD
jgi:hypothetical protein